MAQEHTLDHVVTPDRSRALGILEVVAVAGAVALAAQVRIGGPVPFTLQTLPVLLAPFAVGRNRAMAGLALYLGLGLAGVPVFAGATAIGATFGYLLAFVMVPAVMCRFRNPATAIVAGLMVVFVCGVTWLCLWLHLSPWQGIVVGCLPFLPGEFVQEPVFAGGSALFALLR